MKRSGSADLPLHNGHVPLWLSERMSRLGLEIVRAMVSEFSSAEVVRRMSDPFWFQSLGAVMGMDWHSSGITTSVLGALKRSVNQHSNELGLYICGGKGKSSMRTPEELMAVGYRTGLDGNGLSKNSRLTAKVDNTAIQDGFQLYLHSFILNDKGQWAVIQQGMNGESGMARRYHWHSENISSFTDEPHTAIYGKNQGKILNFTHKDALATREHTLGIARQDPNAILSEVRHLKMPIHHDVRSQNVDLKRLGAMLWLTHENQPDNFDELLLLKGMGPRTLQSLALVSEVIYGTPTRFDDPARFSFAHGGKDGHPFPVPTRVYDETISVLKSAVDKSRLGLTDKMEAVKKLSELSYKAEAGFQADKDIDTLIASERTNSWKYGGRTIFGPEKPPQKGSDYNQLSLF